MRPTRILLIGDGRPGHTNLAEGIAAAITRRQPTDITRITVSRGGWPGPVAALLTRSTFTPAKLLKIIYGLEARSLPQSDIVISAGAETIAANICAAKHLGAGNIFYGSLRQYRPTDFSLVLTSYARSARAANIVQTLKPSALDPETLPSVLPETGSRAIGLLVGGDTGGLSYAPRDWQALIQLITAIHEEHGVRWHASNSRRTPSEATQLLRELAQRSDGPIANFIDVSTPKPGSLTDLFAAVDSVVCTADSSSMISETIWARRPLVTVAPRRFILSPNETAYRNWLVKQGWCRGLNLASLTSTALLEHLRAATPLSSNPLDALAELLSERLPLSRTGGTIA